MVSVWAGKFPNLLEAWRTQREAKFPKYALRLNVAAFDLGFDEPHTRLV